jgi:hypothetical protein
MVFKPAQSTGCLRVARLATIPHAMPDELEELRDVGIEDLSGLPDLTWFSSEPLGHYSSLSTVSSGPVAILAGFTLTSATALATTANLEACDVAAIGVLGLSAACLFIALVLVAEANSYFSTPADRIAWFPEASVSRTFLEGQRQRQRNDFLRFDAFRRRALQWYSVGAALALVGLALVLVAVVDGTAFEMSWSEDTLSDAAAIVGAVAVSMAAVYILSFAPFDAFESIAQRREDRILKRAHQRWPNLSTVNSTDLTDASMLRDWPPKS